MKTAAIVLALLCSFSVTSQSTFKKSFHPDGGCPDAITTIDGGYALLTTGGYPGMVKCDADGNTKWALGLEYDNILYAQEITESKNEEYFLLMSGIVQSNRQMIISKITKDGKLSQAKRFFHSRTNEARAIIADGEGGVMFTGGGCNGNNYVIRLDSDLNVIFEKGYDILSTASATKIISCSNGNFIIAGTALDGNGDRAAVLIEIDIDGEIIWSASYTGLPETTLHSVIELQDGGYAFAGQAKYSSNGSSDMIICRLDERKEVVWIRILETGWESIQDLLQLPDGDLFFCGSLSMSGNNDGLVGRMGLDGRLDYLKTMKGTRFDVSDVLNNLLPICEDKFAVFGDTDGGSLFFIDDHGEGFCNSTTLPLSMVDVQDALYQKLDEEVTPATLSFQSADISFTAHSDFLEEEVFCNYTDPEDTTCGKVSNTGEAFDSEFVVFPNPTSETISISNSTTPILSISIFDGNKRKVLSVNSRFEQIDISNLANGLYVVEVKTKKEKFATKIIKN